jgi:hypothetical protein
MRNEQNYMAICPDEAHTKNYPASDDQKEFTKMDWTVELNGDL